MNFINEKILKLYLISLNNNMQMCTKRNCIPKGQRIDNQDFKMPLTLVLIWYQRLKLNFEQSPEAKCPEILKRLGEIKKYRNTRTGFQTSV